MFREMRRKKQELTKEKSLEILEKGSSGVLSLLGDEDYAYGVPISYVYHDSKLYFHSATSGHKVDAVRKHEKVSFCVVDKDAVVPEEFTTYYRSVVVFGRARVIEGDEARRKALEILAAKYSPDHEESRLKEIDKELKHVCMIELQIEHMTGKEAIELVKGK